ncbi:MAG: GNAT family N-acetyltransferase [Gemmatimonadales bacterium]
MSGELFRADPPNEIVAGMRAFRSRFDAAVFVAERADGGLAGFVEVGARAYADGCDTSPVGYIEAWYVDPDVRGTGVGRALVAAGEAWARALGFREMASDALIENDVSHRAHRALGYAEVEHLVLFRRELAPTTAADASIPDASAKQGCLFCRILAGELPGSIVYRDEQCAAFMDIQPVNPGHLLVAPLRHATDLVSLDPLVGARLFQVAQHLAAAIRASGLRCEGVNLLLADGEAAMQEVFHLHLHVFPRYRGDGFGLRFGPEYAIRPPRAALDDAAARIRTALTKV